MSVFANNQMGIANKKTSRTDTRAGKRKAEQASDLPADGGAADPGSKIFDLADEGVDPPHQALKVLYIK